MFFQNSSKSSDVFINFHCVRSSISFFICDRLPTNENELYHWNILAQNITDSLKAVFNILNVSIALLQALKQNLISKCYSVFVSIFKLVTLVTNNNSHKLPSNCNKWSIWLKTWYRVGGYSFSNKYLQFHEDNANSINLRDIILKLMGLFVYCWKVTILF